MEMKHAFPLLLGIWLTVSLAGCAPAQAQPVPTGTPVPPTATTQPTPTATPAPTDADTFGPWKLVHKLSYAHPVTLAGFLNDMFGLTIGYDGEVHYTTDGGLTWPTAKNQSFCRFGLEIVDENVAWTCGNGGNVRLSTDGGRTWKAVEDFGPSEPRQCRYLSFLDTKTGWAATPYEIGATTDGGQTWTEIALPKGSAEIMGMTLRTATSAFLLDKAGTFFKTVDGGKTWIGRPLGLAEKEYLSFDAAPRAVMRFTDDEHGELVFTLITGAIVHMRTDNGGETWTRETIPDLDGANSYFYLAPDGKTLTITDSLNKEILVLRYQPS
jgi:photosystem II stability/assembly factor-like uncharacterized protein